ncbi:competence/damage-inducible protein CinA [Metamycoplasma arthritidis]|uniref:Competence/damage-inducible protein CinA n=1 Tax=Metamycoplasma arthritidis (strain 158L3-1) TaxID=243272 RepID=B3PM50_META1|nr:CinA family protein [Metamycoplasma arthritidis]ACF07102.1 competence/damage-inducible protein CinA [Metamycoplasma arthritidis 158L3-1]VEU78630.1 competence/damage-inducible protein CinA [Metamycoplasma arthritidis]
MKNNKSLSAVESFTGGLFASEIVSVPGASQYFLGALVSYSNAIKQKLGISTHNGVINKEVALAMAKAGNEFFGSDICVSFTGNAGPGVMDDKPAGLVYIAINDEVYELNLIGGRNSVRQEAVTFAIKKLKDMGILE